MLFIGKVVIKFAEIQGLVTGTELTVMPGKWKVSGASIASQID